MGIERFHVIIGETFFFSCFLSLLQHLYENYLIHVSITCLFFHDLYLYFNSSHNDHLDITILKIQLIIIKSNCFILSINIEFLRFLSLHVFLSYSFFSFIQSLLVSVSVYIQKFQYLDDKIIGKLIVISEAL